ncbi:hypothetical protein DP939_25190 [Spongiactinospora rosea]|uniref:Uncharacterized protein n=1 Tax=Spongiactinospora rosea TaxID=2248750 RepID=A0A366LTG4_9ACTN|nr:helix-turn-helix domain-containing protein [Spongiactinospora rosea]RBQ17245.1 hypothetical protein DP939_25190 [Spongiactinospora rosea]
MTRKRAPLIPDDLEVQRRLVLACEARRRDLRLSARQVAALAQLPKGAITGMESRARRAPYGSEQLSFTLASLIAYARGVGLIPQLVADESYRPPATREIGMNGGFQRRHRATARREQAVKLRTDGWTMAAIAAHLGVSPSAVYRYLNPSPPMGAPATDTSSGSGPGTRRHDDP